MSCSCCSCKFSSMDVRLLLLFYKFNRNNSSLTKYNQWIQITHSNKNVWDNQVKFITTNITDAVIDDAFSMFPNEVKSETISDIKRKLQGKVCYFSILGSELL